MKISNLDRDLCISEVTRERGKQLITKNILNNSNKPWKTNIIPMLNKQKHNSNNYRLKYSVFLQKIKKRRKKF